MMKGSDWSEKGVVIGRWGLGRARAKEKMGGLVIRARLTLRKEGVCLAREKGGVDGDAGPGHGQG